MPTLFLRWRQRLSALSVTAVIVSAGCSSPGTPATTAADLVIANGTIVTMNDQRDVLEGGTVVIRGSDIVEVGPASIAAKYRAARTVDARGGIVMPGLINTHTHVSMTVFRGLGDDVPDRLRTLIFPLEKALIDRELVFWGGLHGMAEMIEGGVTTFVDMYYFEDEVARATVQAGLRGVLGETIVNFAAPDAPEPYGGLGYARSFAAQYRNHPLVTPALAPHAPYSLDEGHLREIAKEADALNLPILMHVAEMTDEVETLRTERGQTPVEYLDAIGLLSPRLLAAHGVYVTDSDIALLKARDVGLAHAVVSNAKSARPVAPATKMFKSGLRIGLASDGAMSGNTLDIIGQMGYVAKIHKLDQRDRRAMPAVDVVEMATRGGARALHMESRLGSLEAGKLADVIVLDGDATTLVPRYDVYSSLVYATSPKDVVTTIVHGRVLMQDRRLTTIDVRDVRTRMRAIGRKIEDAVAKGIPGVR